MEEHKRFIAKKFNGWYSQQISDELEAGNPLEETNGKLRLSILKTLHLVEFCNNITSAERKEIILNEWKATDI